MYFIAYINILFDQAGFNFRLLPVDIDDDEHN